MRLKTLVWASAAVILAASLTSCNIGKAPEPTPDVNGIYTAAARTMVAGLNAQQTQTAAAVPPTPQASATPLVSPTALATFAISTGSIPFGTPFTLGTPGTKVPTLPAGTGLFSFPVGCDDAMFIGETRPYDKTQYPPNKLFDKGWSLQNVGTCTWDDGYSFAFKDGENFSVNNPVITIAADKSQFTAPQHSQSFIFHMTAPKQPGEYIGRWQMRNDAGVWFGSIVTVDIIVVRAGQDTPTPKSTP